MSRIIDPKNIAIVVLAAACLFLFFRDSGQSSASHEGEEAPAAEAAATIWTCSMDPQIQLPRPGDCPICGMDLIPLEEEGDQLGPWALKLSPSAMALADIQTSAVVRRPVAHQVRMVGKVDYDEKRLSDITAWVSGRIERLFVDFTGLEVRKGDHMVELYSPDLITAQQELRQALSSVENGPTSILKASRSRLKAARRKLALLGLSEAQITAMETREDPLDLLTIEAPMSGVVIRKHLNEGSYVKTGSPIYTLADLSRVWVNLEAYESDLTWLRYGQEVSFEVEAYPGEQFHGRIVFIDPVLDPRTRTVKVRIDMPNPDGRLKPEMFVRAKAQAMISPGGKVIDPSLADKWICPMHPGVVEDDSGSCEVCGMDLVQAADLGFVTSDPVEAPLVVPASAALITGQRAVVYLADPQQDGVFRGREVVLGPLAGDYYIVKEGLQEGDQVVTNGAFKIDSELQIRAKNSMMYPPEAQDEEGQLAEQAPAEAPSAYQTSGAFRDSLKGLYEAYFAIQGHLSQDALTPAKEAAGQMQAALGRVEGAKLEGKPQAVWDALSQALAGDLKGIASAAEIDVARSVFEGLSQSMDRLALQLGLPDGTQVLRYHCPMAFDNRGADWLQKQTGTANPYYGSAMFACGSQVADLAELRAELKSSEEAGEGHQHD